MHDGSPERTASRGSVITRMDLESDDFFLFVSHVTEDRAAASQVVDELERRGVRCWIAPRNVRPPEVLSTTTSQMRSKSSPCC